MVTLLQEFRTREKEVDRYLSFLSKLEGHTNQGLYVIKKQQRLTFIDKNLFKILKANSFLIIYNLIESSINSGFEDVYKRIQTNNIQYQNLKLEFKSLWVSRRLHQVRLDPSSSWITYENKVKDLAEHLIAGRTIELDKRAISAGGNYNADIVRQVFRKHGIGLSIPTKARGGVVLETVTTQRNNLAHGNISFSDCGRDFTCSDLVKIKLETSHFIAGVLKSLKKFKP